MNIKSNSIKLKKIFKGNMVFLGAYNNDLYQKINEFVSEASFSRGLEVKYEKANKMLVLPTTLFRDPYPEHTIYQTLGVLAAAGKIPKALPVQFARETNCISFVWKLDTKVI